MPPNPLTAQTGFVPWVRPSMAETARAGGQPRNRAIITATATLTERKGANAGKEVERLSVPLEIMGPADVGGLQPGAVKRVHPAPGVTDASPAHCPYVEFSSPDLPWRYSPGTPFPNDRLRPWLALIVVRDGTDECVLQPGGTALVSSSVLRRYPLSDSWAWAHVQTDGPIDSSDLPPTATSRILCAFPKRWVGTGDQMNELAELEANCSYLALLVGTYRAAGDGGLADAWEFGQDADDDSTVELRVYHQWRFATGEGGSFDDLARALTPYQQVTSLGRRLIRYGPVGSGPSGGAVDFGYTGPLAAAATSGKAPPSLVVQDLNDLAGRTVDQHRRPVLTIPDYSAAWLNPEAQGLASIGRGGWPEQMRNSPGLRVAAGLGAWCAQEMQEQIAAAAARHLEQTMVARHQARGLALGASAATGLWERRLPEEPLDRLGVLAVAAAGLVVRHPGADQPLTLSRLLTEPAGDKAVSPVPKALFSAAAQRVLRPGTARTRRAAAAVTWGAVFTRANTCPGRAPEPPGLVGLEHYLGGDHTTGDLESALRDLAGSLASDSAALPDGWDWGADLQGVDPERSPDPERACGDYGDQTYRLNELAPLPAPPPTKCRPLDPQKVSRTFDQMLDPGREDSAVVRRIRAGWGPEGESGESPLVPPEPEFTLDLDGWRFLRDRAPELLCPGVTSMPDGAAAVVRPQSEVVEAFLLGFNTAAAAELRWRNIPVPSGSTPGRTFWGLVPQGAAAGQPLPDISPVNTWRADSDLGSHRPPEGTGSAPAQVVLIRTPIFRRWPSTAVFLVTDANNEPDWDAKRLLPRWQASLGEDLVLLWFDAPVSEHWLVLEEAPPELRFTRGSVELEPENPPAPTAAQISPKLKVWTSARVAAGALDLPTRVGLWGGDLSPPTHS